MIAAAAKLYAPCKVWALCSGGNDSLCSTHLAMSTGLCDGVASINTTIGIQETREHMQMVADKFGWPLRWLTPPVSYEDICAKHGMPGPGTHGLIYVRLKERCVDQLVRESKKRMRDRVLLITGVRASESIRRMGNAVPVDRDGASVWVAPILNWDNEDKAVYQIQNNIPRNPVTQNLGISGECLCGAFAKPDERVKIAAMYPEAMELIERCEGRARENCKPCAWGKPPSFTKHLCQQCDRKGVEELA